MQEESVSRIARFLQEGHDAEAETEIKKLLSEAPEDVQAWILEAALHEARGNLDAELDALAAAMRLDPSNYEVFYMLGILYAWRNVNQACLCMEQALWYCKEEADREHIRAALAGLKQREGFCVRPFSALILSYNDKDTMIENIKAFRRDCPAGAYELVVVDNHSDDGIAEWLRDQGDVRLIESGENVGFPVGCNIGYQACREGNDIFLVNNDAVPAQNAVFWLRMGLYEEKNVGATGAVSNRASTQNVQDAPKTLPECLVFGAKRNIPMRHPYEDRCRLTGFALMLRHDAHAMIRYGKNLLDTRFSPGYFEDDDLGMRLAAAGYRQLVCHNAFIYHKGGTGFAENDSALTESREKFIDKWGFDIWAFEGIWKEMAALIEEERDVPVRVLELYCGMGIDLSYIRFLYPYAYVAGYDPDAMMTGLGAHMGDLYAGDAETARFPWTAHSFDYIIAADAIKNARDAKRFTEKLAGYVKESGAILYEQPADEAWMAQMERLMHEAGFLHLEQIGQLVRARRA